MATRDQRDLLVTHRTKHFAPRAAERGSTAIIISLLMTVFCASAAFVTDVGHVYDLRAKAQTAADNGVLGGALYYASGRTAVSNQIAAIVRNNLDPNHTDTSWATAWRIGRCADSHRKTFRGVVDGYETDCISFDATGTMRVKVPDRSFRTNFAGVFGHPTMSTTAVAEVQLVETSGRGVLPFVAFINTPSGALFCLRSAANGQASAPCNGGITGNFGPVEIPQWGNPGTNTQGLPCNLNKNTQIAINIAVGIDHVLIPDTGADILDDCSKIPSPNTLNTFEGIAGGLWDGMLAGVTVNNHFYSGRLSALPKQASLTLHQGSSNFQVDNRPLWDYIPTGKGSTVPATCKRETYPYTFVAPAPATANTQLAKCLTAYAAQPVGTYAALFDLDADHDGVEDIVHTGRFGIVPQMVEATFPNGDGWLHIARFRAVFIENLYFQCLGGNVCNTIVRPGERTGTINIPNGSKPLDQVDGFLLPYGALPNDAVYNGVGGLLGPYRPHLTS